MQENTLLNGSRRETGMAFQRVMNKLLGTRFELKPLGSNRFDGEILSSHLLGGMRNVDIRFTAHSTRLLPGRTRHRAQDTCLISWQMEGKSRVSQSGRECIVEPGQIFIIDTSKPFEIETTDMRTRSIHMNSTFLRAGFPEYEHFTATPFDSLSGAGVVCSGMISHIFSSSYSATPSAIGRFADGLAHLLAVALFERDDTEESESRFSPEVGRMMRVKSFIRQNLADPMLDCGAICATSGVSLRHLHHLFSKEGTTVMRWVWSERLRNIACDLEKQSLAHRTISSIAFDWGYSEAAHFSRTFKGAFGMTPLKYRKQSLGHVRIN